MTRVLVTGVGGFLGSHLVERLIQNPLMSVVCVESFRHNGDTGRLANVVTPELRDRVTIVTHDLRVPFTLRQVNAIGHVDVVISAASMASVDQSIVDPANFILNNVAVTVHTLDIAREVGCSLVVHISTDEVYGTSTPCSLTHHQPSSPYAASKAAQEDVCLSYATTFNLPTCITASANMFGERQSQLAFIPRVVNAALTEQTVTVHTHNGQPGRRNYTYVREVADFVVTKIERVPPQRWPARVALTGRHLVANDDIVKMISEIMGREVNFRLQEGNVARPGYDDAYPSISSDDDDFNDWDAVERSERRSLQEQLTDTVNWFVSHPEWLRA